MRAKLPASAGLTAILLFFAHPAFALSDGEKFPPGMMSGAGCGYAGDIARREMMGGRVWRLDAEAQGRLAFLKSELTIADAQAEAWKGYADAVIAQALALETARAAMRRAMVESDAPARLDAQIAATEARLQSLKAVRPALRKLYDALGAEQRKLADDLIGEPCSIF